MFSSFSSTARRTAVLAITLAVGLGIVAAASAATTSTTPTTGSSTASPLPPPTPAQLSALGASPTAAATEPSPLGDLPADQPLISATFSNGQVVSVTGSAVSQPTGRAPDARHQDARAHAAQGITVTCHVNFTRQRKRAVPKGASNVRWYGGIACGRNMFLYGQAFLLQNHKTYWGFANYYEGIMRSGSSGKPSTYVPPGASGAQRSLYIRHLTNAYFPNPLMTGVITITPSKGTTLNKATKCGLGKPITYQGVTYPHGLHCDLYSERF